MFEYNNETYTLESLQKGAEEQGLEFDAYLKGMMNLGMKEIKGESSQGDVTVKDEDMASNSEDGFLESPKPEDVAKKIPRQEWEVEYDYDRSKGLRRKDQSYGKYMDNIMYGVVGKTIQSFQSGSPGELSEQAMNVILMDEEKRGKMTEEDAKPMIDAMKLADQAPKSEAMQEWVKIADSADNPIYGFVQAMGKHGVEVSYEAMISSMAGQAKAFWESPEIRTAAITAGVAQSRFGGLNPYLRVAGFMRGMMSVLGGSVETASTFSELIKEQFEGQIPSEKEFLEFAQNEELFNEFRNKALKKGLTVAAVDNFGGGMVVKSVAKTAKKGKKVSAVTKGIVGEGAVGATGEIAGSAIAGEEIQASAVGLEIIGQGPQAVIDIGAAIITPGTYKINGEKVTLKQLNKVLETAKPSELVDIKIQIEGNKELEAEVNSKKNDAYLYTQVNEKVDDADRSELVNLEKQRAQAEANTKKKGIFTVPNAKAKLENIESQIAEIVGRYEAVDGRTSDVKSRKKTAGKARQARMKILMEKIKSGVESSKLYKEMDISTEQITDPEKAYKMYLENEESNALFDIGLLQEELANVKTEGEKKLIQSEIKAIEDGVKNVREGKSEVVNSHGFLLEDSNTGKMKIVINEKKALADGSGNINVAAHEFLHAVLNKTFNTKENTFAVKTPRGLGASVGGSLFQYLKGLDPNITTNSFMGRLLNYAQQGQETQGQEVLTLMSDALVDGTFKPNEKTLNTIGDYFTSMFESLGTGKLKWKNAKDVARFIKNFNKSIQGDKSAARIVKRAEQGIDIVTESDTQVEVKKTETPLSKEASDNVQRIYEDRGDAGAFDIIEAFKPITSKIVQRRSEAPNFDRELLTSEIEIGKRGILDLIREYNVNSGVPLAAYINKFLPARAIEASRRVLGEEFTTDITERVDVAAEEVTQEPTKPKKKKIVLADRLGVTDKVSKAINKIVPNLELDKLNFKTLKNKVPVITGDLFGISPKKIENLANLTKKELQSAQMFINKNADLLISMLPEGATASGTATGVPNTLLKAFYTKADRAKMAKTGSKAGLAVQQKNNINKTDFLETFGIIDGKPDRTDRNTSARVLALASLTGKMITNQAVRGELAKLKVNDKAINKIAEGKSQVMFSKDANAFNIDGTIDNLLGVHAAKVGRKTFKLRTEEDVDLYIEALISDVLPLMPRAFWFGKEEGVSDTGSEFTPSDRVIDIPKSRKQERKDLYVYYKQQVNALNQLPEDAFGSSIGVTDFSRPSYSSLFEGKKGVQVEKIKETNKRTAKIHEALWSRIYDAIQENPSKAATIGNYFKLVSKQNNHWHRAAAEIIGYSPSPKGTAKKLYEYEHAMPASASYLYLIDGALKGYDFKSIYNPVMDNFKLIALDAAENKKLNEAGLADRMPEGWNTTDNKWWERYFNDKVDIDSESIVTLDGKTFKQEFNIVQLKPDLKNNVKFSKAMSNSRVVKDPKGITVLDFDDTLATTKSLVKFTTPDGKTGTLNAEQFASTYEDLQDQGYTFDFSDFNKVVKGKLAPLFNKAIKLQGKFGPENMFVLTARPPQAQKAIFDFLKANGLNIPIKNITGLGNSTAEAKALWIADKVADGYNDFYFADDALQNVQAVKNMLDQFDVKSKVQQAKVQFSKDASSTFNDIIQATTGIESQKVFSEAQARIRGQKSKYKSIIPPSAQDFGGLLYSFLGKGKKGEQDMAFFKKALIDPFARGINELNAARQASANDYENLLKQFPEVKKLLNKKIEGTDYTHDQAVRIYLWEQAGFEVPGLSKRDLKSVVDFVEDNSKVKAFADTIGLISKKEDGYSAPGDYWLAENIKSDLLSDGSIGDARAEFLAEWQQNADLIFSPENLNKIEAIYGGNFREALQDVLYRMKTGRNRPAGGGRLMNMYTNWVNNSVGAIMFLNMRSALLQTISATNYINWSDNNPLKAAAAFANQKQYWSDFSYLFNSDYLKQRRSGNQRGINEAELSAAVAGAENKAKAAIAWLLKKGFLPTQIADSFAISSGGATFYRNRIKAYIKQGMSKVDAEQKAFLDFQETTEVAQQSARPDMISQQQASPLGKLILAFQNTPMQYARIMNKAARDIYNGRGDMKTHTSKIIYYGFVQSIIFGALQSALFASLDDEDEEKFDKKKERILNGMIDSVLSGIGYGGKAISTMKNTLTTFLDQRKRGFNADHTYTILQLLGFSPPIGSKLRKIYSSIQTDKFNKDVFKRRGLTLDNPIWSAVGNVVEGVTNVPLGRFSQKMLNIDNALDANNKWWQRAALVLGWNTWDLGIKDADIEGIKKEIKKEKKVETKEKTRIKREEKKKEKEEENKSIIEENKKKSKKDGLCSAVSKGGKRCKNKAINGGMCTIHEKAEQRKDGKQTQCIKRKANGKRCGMKTSSKSGLCYYHD